jgi:hypothetical protein
MRTGSATINGKSSVTQEMEYALCWRQSPVVLFPLKKPTKQKTQSPFLTGIYSPPFPSPFACSGSSTRAGPSPAPQAPTSPPPPPSTPSHTGFCLKFQKLENWKNRSIEELLGEAQKVYVRREKKNKTKSKDYVIHDGAG